MQKSLRFKSPEELKKFLDPITGQLLDPKEELIAFNINLDKNQVNIHYFQDDPKLNIDVFVDCLNEGLEEESSPYWVFHYDNMFIIIDLGCECDEPFIHPVPTSLLEALEHWLVECTSGTEILNAKYLKKMSSLLAEK